MKYRRRISRQSIRRDHAWGARWDYYDSHDGSYFFRWHYPRRTGRPSIVLARMPTR